MVNGSSEDGALITLVLEIRFVLEDGLDSFHHAIDIGFAADPANSYPSRLASELWRRVLVTIRIGVPGARPVMCLAASSPSITGI